MNKGEEMNLGLMILRFLAWAMGGRLDLYGGYTMIAPTSTGTRSGEILVKGILKSFKCDDRYRNTSVVGISVVRQTRTYRPGGKNDSGER